MHSRMTESNGAYFYDGVEISRQEWLGLCHHYEQVKRRLAEPWLRKDDHYDTLGRYNTGVRDEDKL